MPKTITHSLKSALGAGLGLVMAAAPAAVRAEDNPAGAACGPHEQLTERLQEKHGEAPVSLGLDAKGRLVQVFTSEAGGTWTIVITRAEGPSCIVASGRHWQQLDPPPDGPAI